MSEPRRIDQLLAGFADGDAISHAALSMQEVFRRWGVTSDIYAVSAHVSPSLRGQCRPLEEYRAGPADIAIHHYSIGSPALDLFRVAPGPRILVYHNVTPAEYFDGFDDAIAAQLRHARAELQSVGRDVQAVWAVSEFNARELRSLGLPNVKVFPLLFSKSQIDRTPDPEVLAAFQVKLATVMTCGRIAPNKKVEHLIEAFYWYHKAINPFSRLLVVGSERSCPKYFEMLRMYVGDLDLANVCFVGFASPAGLPAYYKSSDLFVSTSEHEGYCLPLLEAMRLGVPVIARATGGMPEAMGGAGVLYEDISPNELAGLMHRVISEEPLRREVLESQRVRMDAVLARDVESELKELLRGLV